MPCIGALAGPGPRTLANRLRLASRSIELFSDVSSSHRPRRVGFAAPSIVTSPARAGCRPSSRSQPSVTSRLGVRTYSVASDTSLDIVDGTVAEEDEAFNDDDDPDEEATPGVAGEQLDPSALQAYARTSKRIAWSMHKKSPKQVTTMVFQRPQEWEPLLTDAVEAAARDQWLGLYKIMVSLLMAGLPSEVEPLFDRYTKRVGEVQGRDPTKLGSPDRAERVAARPTGQGLGYIGLAYIGSRTMTDNFDTDACMRLLIYGPHLNSLSFHDIVKLARPIEHASGTQDFLPALKINLTRFKTAFFCYHPLALERRLSELAKAGSLDMINRLYKSVLRNSVGPNRLLHTKYEVEERDGRRYYTVVPLTDYIWRAFLGAFTRFTAIEQMWKLIKTDRPDRGAGYNAYIVGSGMMSFAIFSVRKDLSPEKRDIARRLSNLLWEEHLQDTSRPDNDNMIAYRLSAVDLMDPQNDGKFYRQACSGAFGPCGPFTHGNMAVGLFQRGQPDRALALVEDIVRTYKSGPAVETLFGNCFKEVLQKYSPAQARQIMYRMMKLKTSDITPRVGNYGLLLCNLLDLDVDPRKAVQAILSACRAEKYVMSNIDFWMRLMSAMLTRLHYRPSVTVGQARAAIELLHEFRRSADKIRPPSPRTLCSIFTFALRSIMPSGKISPEVKSEILEDIIAWYPAEYRIPPSFGTIITTAVLELPEAGTVQRSLRVYDWVVERALGPTASRMADLIRTMVTGMLRYQQVQHARSIVETHVRDSPTQGLRRALTRLRDMEADGRTISEHEIEEIGRDIADTGPSFVRPSEQETTGSDA